MAVKDRVNLKVDLQTKFPDNTEGAISETDLRSQQRDIIDSAENVTQKGQPNGYCPLNGSGEIDGNYISDDSFDGVNIDGGNF